jgi:twinkle protein
MKNFPNFLPDTIDFSQYLKDTDAKAKVKSAHVWTEEMKLALHSKTKLRKVSLPWSKTLETFEFRPGEVTVWGGINGHGKSLVTAQVSLSLVGQGEKVCVASFEMKPSKQMQRYYRMWCGVNPYSPEFQSDDGILALEDLYDQFGEWCDNKLWLYDQQGTTNTETVLGMVKYCAKELNIQHVFIDNLAKCIKIDDDYSGQKNFIDEICAIARDFNIHIHVVHHMRKVNKETDQLDKNDFKGSGTIADQVDNLLGVWRNKAKELEVKQNNRMNTKSQEPDQTIRVFKQRNHDGLGDGEPLILLWFHQQSWQFLESASDRPMSFYNPWPHIAS